MSKFNLKTIAIALISISPSQVHAETTNMQLDPNWEFVADTVMGGVSSGTLSTETREDRAATVLRGTVSLDNNGGFVQMAFNLRDDGSRFDATAWDGIELTVMGPPQTYDLRLRTDQLSRPWQSFRTDFEITDQWQTLKFPFVDFVAHRVDVAFDPAQLRRIGILAIGREFEADVAVSGIRLYRD